MYFSGSLPTRNVDVTAKTAYLCKATERNLMVFQISDTVLMVRPAHFGFNEETAASNAFQTKNSLLSNDEISRLALAEFDAFVDKLRAAGIRVLVVEDTPSPLKTDAVFPNNWITTHSDGVVITYPMYSPMRRLERRRDIIDQLSDSFVVTNWLRMEQHESEQVFLEGTGSMILDRTNHIVYACRSVRTDEQLLREFADGMRYRTVVFNAVDPAGLPIYHTNVMMALADTFAIICLDSITNEAEREEVIQSLQSTRKEIIPITYDQMMHYAGNMLQVRNDKGDSFLVMSQQAYQSLQPEQLAAIQHHSQILYSDLQTIEKYGGGSARCMLAEIFLPTKD